MRTLSEVVFQDNSQLRLFTALAALLTALGFLFSTTNNNNYLFLNTVAYKKLWGGVFLSFTYFDSTPITSTEWLLLIPFLAELWVL